MKCPNEFTRALYADGELPEEESHQLRSHLDLCVDCREHVAALKAENRLFRRSLQDIESWEEEFESVGTKAPARQRSVLLVASVMGFALLIRLFSSIILDFSVPSSLDWLDPFSLPGLLNWTTNGFFYFIGEGGAMLASFVGEISVAVLALLILGTMLSLARRLLKTTAIAGLTAGFILCAVSGYTMDLRMARDNIRAITIASDETINDTLVAFGDSVNVNGTITGDLVAFARQISIQGTVQGNVIVFGQRIGIPGKVAGDVMGFAQSLQINGSVGRNLWGFIQTLDIGTGGRVEDDATLFAAELGVGGDIGRDLTTFCAAADVSGKVGRDLRFRGGRLLVRAPSTIGRDLNARVKSEKNVQIDTAVSIAGKKTVVLQEPEPNKYATFGFYVRQALGIVAAFLAGLILFGLPLRDRRLPLSTTKGVLISGGTGFLAAVATPVAVIILAITVVGLPIALVSLALWLLGLYLSKIVIARCIGDAILGPGNGGGMKSTALALIIGLLIVYVAANLPFIGGVLNIILMLIGLGALVITAYRMYEGRRSAIETGTAAP